MPEPEIVVVVIVNVEPGRADEVIETFTTVIEATHGEEGCLTYALHRDKNNENQLTIVEHWRSQADLDNHFTQPHMAAVGGLGDALTGPPQIIVCEPIIRGNPEKNLAAG